MSKIKFDVLSIDPPWTFADQLKHSKVKRGAASQYSTLTIEDLRLLPIKNITAANAVLALWVPSSLLQEGLDLMKEWGFCFKQTVIWVKTTKNPFQQIKSKLRKKFTALKKEDKLTLFRLLENLTSDFDWNQTLGFYMGSIFRQSHEVVLIGTRGKMASQRVSKSMRSVIMDVNRGHSIKPEELQDRLEAIFPLKEGCKSKRRALELFARRQRTNWCCIGNDSPMTKDEDIKISLNKLQLLFLTDYNRLLKSSDETEMFEKWSKLPVE